MKNSLKAARTRAPLHSADVAMAAAEEAEFGAKLISAMR